MTEIIDAERKDAVEWLDRAYARCDDQDGEREYIATIKAMLAEPRLPEAVDEGAVRVMIDAFQAGFNEEEIWRALRVHLMRPRTKTVWRATWREVGELGWHYAGEHYAPGLAWDAVVRTRNQGHAVIVIESIEVSS